MGDVVQLFAKPEEASAAFEIWSAMARELAADPLLLLDTDFMRELDEANRDWRSQFNRLGKTNDAR